MSDLKTLAHRLLALEDRIIACMKCGNCQAVCPMFGATQMEADVARGKLALVDNLAHEIIRDPVAVADKLGRCLLCGSCQAGCPSGVRIMDIFMEARELVYSYIGLSPVKKMIFRILLAKPSLFNFTMALGAPASRLLFKSKTNTPQETVCAPLLRKVIGDRHVRPVPPRSLHALVGTLDQPRSAGGVKVAFFPGCMGDKYYVEMSKACLKVFKHHNVAVFMPDFSCCGIPAISSGDGEGVVRQLKVNLRLLEAGSFDYLVTPCGSCTATIKEQWVKYARRISPSAEALAREIVAKTMDINEFLVKVLGVKAAEPKDFARSVTYHDSCHLKKGLGVSSEPRTVLQSNPSYRFVEMAEADRCCGCGGSFTLFHYDLSRKIGQRKRDNVVASGANVVSAACPACMMQLEDVLSHNKDSIAVKHPVEIYAETLPEA